MSVTGRTCGDCAKCCHLGEIPEFKPYNQWCTFCSTQKRCDHYDARPAPCRQFMCHYLTSDLGEEWRPNQCGLIVSTHKDPNRITVMVDPEQPLRWRETPYIQQLIQWSRENAVTVMVEAEAYAIYPTRIDALGAVGANETIVIHEQRLSTGETQFISERAKITP